jgi:DNA-binding response OmpR family regulator
MVGTCDQMRPHRRQLSNPLLKPEFCENNMQSNRWNMRHPGLCLLIDGSATARSGAGGMLRSLGFTVTHAICREQALEACRDLNLDLILLDWKILQTDGITWLSALRAIVEPRPPKIILCIAEGALEDICFAITIGADKYIQKPFDTGTLRKALAEIDLLGAEQIIA